MKIVCPLQFARLAKIVHSCIGGTLPICEFLSPFFSFFGSILIIGWVVRVCFMCTKLRFLRLANFRNENTCNHAIVAVLSEIWSTRGWPNRYNDTRQWAKKTQETSPSEEDEETTLALIENRRDSYMYMMMRAHTSTSVRYNYFYIRFLDSAAENLAGAIDLNDAFLLISSLFLMKANDRAWSVTFSKNFCGVRAFLYCYT
jgi:hypothetical protein